MTLTNVPPRTYAVLWPALRRYWHPVAMSTDVTDKPFPTKLLDEPLVLVRFGEKAVCLKDLCIHRGTPLSLGWREGDSLVCGYHGWAFDETGRCVRVPALPRDQAIPAKAKVKSYLVKEAYGVVWVCLDDEPIHDIPEFPEWGDPSYEFYYLGPFIRKASAARVIENFVDQAHFPWVHEGILGDREHAEVPPLSPERHGEELRYSLDDVPNKAHPVKHSRNYRLTRPFAIHQRKVREGDGGTEVLFFVAGPRAAKECWQLHIMMRNYEVTPEDERETRHLYDAVIEQDKVIVEAQRPEELPIDLAEEMHLKGPDAVAVAYRRMLAELDVT